jgi:hypothetical protein
LCLAWGRIASEAVKWDGRLDRMSLDCRDSGNLRGSAGNPQQV